MFLSELKASKISLSVLFFAYFYTCLMLRYTIFTIWINNIQNEQKYLPHKSVIELEKLSGSILEASSTGRIVKSKEMKKIWPWNIQCGLVQNQGDATTGHEILRRLEYFKKSKLFFTELTSLSSYKFHSKND